MIFDETDESIIFNRIDKSIIFDKINKFIIFRKIDKSIIFYEINKLIIFRKMRFRKKNQTIFWTQIMKFSLRIQMSAVFSKTMSLIRKHDLDSMLKMCTYS